MTAARDVDAIRAARAARAARVADAIREGACDLAFPGGLAAGMAKLKAGDPHARDVAITFLEVDPMFPGSGYIKEEIIRRIKHFDLTPREIDRVHSAILKVVANRWCRELRCYRTLARRFAAPRLKSALEHLADGGDPEARKRAAWVLAGMEP